MEGDRIGQEPAFDVRVGAGDHGLLFQGAGQVLFDLLEGLAETQAVGINGYHTKVGR